MLNCRDVEDLLAERETDALGGTDQAHDEGASGLVTVSPVHFAAKAHMSAISAMALSVGSRAPHGGVFVLFAIDPFWGYLVAIAAGVVVSTAAVLAMKQFWPNKAVEEAAQNVAA